MDSLDGLDWINICLEDIVMDYGEVLMPLPQTKVSTMKTTSSIACFLGTLLNSESSLPSRSEEEAAESLHRSASSMEREVETERGGDRSASSMEIEISGERSASSMDIEISGERSRSRKRDRLH
ncbi:hypothetical protein LOK49_Contig254G00001 [Camellia lanceoleosa]|nr:hypothetical protein LOK49_Contig254G00001 [Camellia lanceoleosa]